jgi:hypothetical protein
MTIRIKSVVMVISTVIGLTQIGSAHKPLPVSTLESDKESFLRRIRFGNRELNLPSRLRNDELELKYRGLENDIEPEVRSEGRDLERITVDQFRLDQDKAAIKVGNWFAQVWSNPGDKELQRKLSDVEKRFDKADGRCRPRSDASDRFGDETTAPTNALEETAANCADFNELYSMVNHYQIKVSAPPPTVFKHRNTLTTGEQLLHADTLQLAVDTVAHLSTQLKTELINCDRGLIDVDKIIWLQEIFHADTLKYNNEHATNKMADNLGLILLVTDMRQNLAGTGQQKRQQLLAIEAGKR